MFLQRGDWDGEGRGTGAIRFNESGEVIGLVSFSLEPDGDLPGVGYATDLAGVSLHRMVPTIDASNPGWYRGWGVLRISPWHLSRVFSDRAQAEEHLEGLEAGCEVRYGSHRLDSDDFVI